MLNHNQAKARRDQGIEQSLRSAKSAWKAAAYDMLRQYAKNAKRTRKSFKVEDVREYAMKKGMVDSNDHRAWGGIAIRARNDGLIAGIGYAPARSSNLSPKTLWVAL